MSIYFYKNGHPIKHLDEFRPKLDKQWSDGRSSKELAIYAFFHKADFENVIEAVLDQCGLVHQDFIASPETSTGLGPGMGQGGPRWHDLLLVGQEPDEDKRVVIGIEAKVSETFGDLNLGEEKENQKVKYDNDITKTRAYKLEKFLTPNANVDVIGYQLFTSVRGTMMAALNNSCNNCIMLVLVFDGRPNSDSGETLEEYYANREKNDKDVKEFINAAHASNDKIIREIGGENINCWIKEHKV